MIACKDFVTFVLYPCYLQGRQWLSDLMIYKEKMRSATEDTQPKGVLFFFHCVNAPDDVKETQANVTKLTMQGFKVRFWIVSCHLQCLLSPSIQPVSDCVKALPTLLNDHPGMRVLPDTISMKKKKIQELTSIL